MVQVAFIGSIVMTFGAVLALVLGSIHGPPLAPPSHGLLARNREEALRASVVFRWLAPIVAQLATLNARADLPSYRAWLARNLQHAGSPAGLRPEELMAVSQLAALGGILVGTYTSMMLAGRPVGGLLVVLGMLGAALPNLWLAQQVEQRLRSANRGLPYAVNIIVLAMEAGLDFTSAVRRYVALGAHRADGMRDELELVLSEMELGRTRREALEAMAARLPSETIRGMVVAVIQADRLGSPLAKTLREQVQVIQTRKTQTAEKQAAESSVKILGPLMFIFASVFLVLFSSIIIRACGGGLP